MPFVVSPACRADSAQNTLKNAAKSLTKNHKSGGGAMAKRGINYRKHLRRVFLACLGMYREAQINNSSKSCAALYDALGRSGGARPAHSTTYCRATASDFICDFEITAKRVLEPLELAYFNLVFVRGRSGIDEAMEKVWPGKRYGRFCNKLAEKMGFALKGRGLFPLKHYFERVPIFVGKRG